MSCLLDKAAFIVCDELPFSPRSNRSMSCFRKSASHDSVPVRGSVSSAMALLLCVNWSRRVIVSISPTPISFLNEAEVRV